MLLMALLALGLLLVLSRFVNSVSGLTKRSATSVSAPMAGGYGGGTGAAAAPPEVQPPTPDPDSTVANPDSSLSDEDDS
jgi:hypothetical protein